MFLSELFKTKRAVCSFEIFPPKPTADVSAVRGTIEALSALRPDYISVTCSAGGSGNARTPQIAQMVKNCGVEPLAHLTCLHASRADVDSALDELQRLGIENILALRGDRIEGAAESRDFAHASDLAAHIRARGGFDIAGACYPEGHPESASLAEDVRNLKKKVDAGVTHLNTQLFFDNEDFYRFRDLLAAADIDVPVQAGIMPLVKKSHVDRIITLSGAKIPAKISRSIARFYDKPEALMEAGIAYAVDQIIDLLAASGAQGIHLYVMNNPYVARRIAENVADVVAESTVQVDRAEFLRYLGWRGQETDEALLQKLDEAARRCLEIAQPRSTVRRFPLDGDLCLGGTGFVLEGRDVRAHLAGCREVYLFAATIGIAAERELARLSARGAYEALLFDTACSCAIESYCDDVCEDLQNSCARRLLPRFSCGYGDFPLQAQRDICRLLRTDTAIGLCCDESCLLTPRKSVTAVVGITDEPPAPAAQRACGSCAACKHTGCAFRRKDG